MRRFILTIVLLCGLEGIALAAMTWSPDIDWLSSREAVKETPELQFDFARDFEERGEYTRAASEYLRLVKSYPDARIAGNAQFQAAKSLYLDEKYIKSFKYLERNLNEYPAPERTPRIIELEYRIGKAFLEGRQKKVLGFEVIPALFESINIFEAVIANDEYGIYADDAQYAIGMAHLKLENFDDAKQAFLKLIEKYENSELRDDAEYQSALAAWMSQPDAGPSQEGQESARQTLERLKARRPDDASVTQTLSLIAERAAERYYNAAMFYEGLKKYHSARVYYDILVRRYPNSPYTSSARQRLAELGNAGQFTPVKFDESGVAPRARYTKKKKTSIVPFGGMFSSSKAEQGKAVRSVTPGGVTGGETIGTTNITTGFYVPEPITIKEETQVAPDFAAPPAPPEPVSGPWYNRLIKRSGP